MNNIVYGQKQNEADTIIKSKEYQENYKKI